MDTRRCFWAKLAIRARFANMSGPAEITTTASDRASTIRREGGREIVGVAHFDRLEPQAQ